MLTLAIDTSERIVTAAILRNGHVVSDSNTADFLTAQNAEQNPQGSRDDVQYPRTSPGTSAITMPLIQRVLGAAEVPISNVDLFALSKGPGLFTGLRVGVVTAKVLGFALKKPIVAVNSLHVCAEQMAILNQLPVGSRIRSVCNAQRKQLFAATFEVTDSGAQLVMDEQLVERTNWLESIESTDFLTGSGLDSIRDQLPELAESQIAAKGNCQSNAVSVGKLALKKFAAGETDDPWKLEPIYFRPSAAEEKRNVS